MKIDRNILTKCIGEVESGLLAEYFKKVSEIVSSKQDGQYAILLCRRSLIVYEIVRCICNLPKLNHILCSDDLTVLKSGDKAIVVDDIIIHGRTVSELYNRLKSMGIEGSASAFYKKYNAEFLSDEILESYQYICGRNVTESEWHDFSNRLIDLIIKTKIPYTTFTYSFAFEKACALVRKNVYDVVNVKQVTMNESDMKMSVYFDKQYKTDFVLLGNLCNFVCIRQYNSLQDSGYIYIPFVFISFLDKTVFDTLADSFNKISMPSSIIEVFAEDVYSMEYKARFLSFLLSYAYGVIAIESGEVDAQRTEVIKSIIGKSFIHSFEDVLSLSEEQCRKILMLDIKNVQDVPNTLSEDADFFTDFNVNAKCDYTKFITDTIIDLHKENEKRVSNKNKSSWGCKVGDILSTLNGNVDAIGFLISMWDIGKASLSFRECGDIVYGCVADGEQAYRIEHQANAPYARSVLFLRSAFAFIDDLSWDTFLQKYFDYLEANCVDLNIPNDYRSRILQCNEFLQNKAITSLNASGCSFHFGDKLYERTQAFLQKLNNEQKKC